MDILNITPAEVELTDEQVEVLLATLDLEDLVEDMALEAVDMAAVTAQNVDAEIVENDRVVIWLDSLAVKSRGNYLTVLRKFLVFRVDRPQQISTIVFDFLNLMHNAGSKTSVVWSAYSIVCNFLHITLGVDLMRQNHENKRLLAQWRKKETVKQSNVFGKEGFDDYLTTHHLEALHLNKKVIAIIGTHGLCRICELVGVQRKDIKYLGGGCIK
jgi:hypothetical protein